MDLQDRERRELLAESVERYRRPALYTPSISINF